MQLFSTAICPSPPFHPTTLILSLLPLLRTPLPALNGVLHLFHHIPLAVRAHLLMHGIEDLAGLRAVKAAERRRRPLPQPQAQPQAQSNPSSPATGDFLSSQGSFPSPTVGYTVKALLYTPNATTSGDAETAAGARMGEITVLKLALVVCMLQIQPKAPEWLVTSKDGRWRRDFMRLALSPPVGSQEESDEQERRIGILMLLDLNLDWEALGSQT